MTLDLFRLLAVERALERAYEVQAQIERKERSLRRRTEEVARGLAAVMEPGMHLRRSDIGLHAFSVDGSTCLGAAYLEEHGCALPLSLRGPLWR